MKEEIYIHDEDELAAIFSRLKRGRCDECNKFADMIMSPYKVKITKKAKKEELTGKILETRIYHTGFIRNCAEHTPTGVWEKKELPPGEEGIDWKEIDSVYYILTRVQVGWKSNRVLKKYKRKGKIYVYPSDEPIPIFEWRWVVWNPSDDS